MIKFAIFFCKQQADDDQDYGRAERGVYARVSASNRERAARVDRFIYDFSININEQRRAQILSASLRRDAQPEARSSDQSSPTTPCIVVQSVQVPLSDLSPPSYNETVLPPSYEECMKLCKGISP